MCGALGPNCRSSIIPSPFPLAPSPPLPYGFAAYYIRGKGLVLVNRRAELELGSEVAAIHAAHDLGRRVGDLTDAVLDQVRETLTSECDPLERRDRWADVRITGTDFASGPDRTETLVYLEGELIPVHSVSIVLIPARDRGEGGER